MSLQSLLDQMLRSAGVSGGSSPALGTFAKGAAAGGALGLLLGSKRGRRIGGTVLKYGTVAALGALAWRAYQDHQARAQGGPAAAGSGASSRTRAAMTRQGRVMGRVYQLSRAVPISGRRALLRRKRVGTGGPAKI